jgi:hypothetical protein
MVGRAHCSAEDRALIRAFARDLGLLPPDSFYRPIQAACSMFHSANRGDLKHKRLVTGTWFCGHHRRHLLAHSARDGVRQRRQAGKRDVSERRAESVSKC